MDDMENNKAVPVNAGTACDIKTDTRLRVFGPINFKFQNPQQLKNLSYLFKRKTATIL